MEMIKTEELLENKQLREQLKDRVEILDKVKSLMLIPQMECMTIKQVADYYEVDYETVRKQYQRNEDEFIEDGSVMKTPIDFKSIIYDFKILNGTSCPFKNCQQVNGKFIVQIDENTTLEIPNRGIKCFPKRAILRMGMLLRDSRIAKEVRTQLLNVVEKTSDEIKIQDINEEQRLMLEVGEAYMLGDTEKFAQASQKMIAFKNRHINALKAKNEILESDNKLLSGKILKWKDRNFTNAVIRKLASVIHMDYGMAWGILYKQLKYKFGIDVKIRGNKEKPYIQYIKDEEWVCVQESISAILVENDISPTTFFDSVSLI